MTNLLKIENVLWEKLSLKTQEVPVQETVSESTEQLQDCDEGKINMSALRKLAGEDDHIDPNKETLADAIERINGKATLSSF